MTRTASYLIVIMRSTRGYLAVAPSFPELTVEASGARQAYARIKLAIKTKILTQLATGGPLPAEHLVQTRTLRIDLWYLRQQEELQ
jgi:hypothetical protein